MLSDREGILAPALRKLEKRSRFSESDRSAFRDIPFVAKRMKAGSYLIREHDRTKNCCILLSGFAFGSKIVGNGGRQILSVRVPGDMADLQHAMLNVADHNIQMLTAGDVAFVPTEVMEAITSKHPAIGRAMWIETLVDGSISREWIANVGRRDARTRISHLLCEFAARLQAAGLTNGNRYWARALRCLPAAAKLAGQAPPKHQMPRTRGLRALPPVRASDGAPLRTDA
jgi:CRP-like cAMP-binding protein